MSARINPNTPVHRTVAAPTLPFLRPFSPAMRNAAGPGSHRGAVPPTASRGFAAQGRSGGSGPHCAPPQPIDGEAGDRPRRTEPPRPGPWALLAGFILLALGAQPALPEALLDYGIVGAGTEATGDGGSDECDEILTDTATCSAHSSGSRDGASGSASARVEGTLLYDDLAFLTGISTSGRAAGRATAPPHEGAEGYGSAGTYVRFEVVRRSLVAIQGSLGLTVNNGEGCAQVGLTGPDVNLNVRAPGSDCGGDGATYTTSVDEQLMLATGTYSLWIRAGAWADFPPREPQTGSASARFGIDVALRACDNEPTDGPDAVEGTTGDDVLCGEGGDDVIDGKGGNDRLYGGEGSDKLYGGDGDDLLAGGDGDDPVLLGGNGNDRIFGGAGHDGDLDLSGFITISGGSGDDYLDGGEGNDLMDGGFDNDQLHGGPGADILTGGPGVDELHGDEDNDFLKGDADADTLYGGPGHDEINGGGGGDTAYGGTGDDLMGGGGGADQLYGERGSDKLRGQGGNDLLVGGPGKDVLNGGVGDDDLRARDGRYDDVYGGDGQDTAEVDRVDIVTGVEVFR